VPTAVDNELAALIASIPGPELLEIVSAMMPQGQVIGLVATDPASTAPWASWLKAEGWEARTFSTVEAAVLGLRGLQPAAVIVGSREPGAEDGLRDLDRLRRALGRVPVLLVTAEDCATTTIRAFRAGVSDYLMEPVARPALLEALDRALATTHGAPVGRSAADEDPFDGIVGESRPIRDLKRLILQVAPTEVSVFLQGESGVGKELFARAIHRASPRRAGPFVPVNCGAIAESLQDSELFGHERGAYTGAGSRRLGIFEQAQGGTVLLDEVADLVPSTQVRLLRVLQSRELVRVGGQTKVALDIRVVAATHADLRSAVEAGRFRQDLFYRLVVYPIRLCPLRERLDDLPALVDHILSHTPGLTSRGPSPEALELLRGYPWPGNVRELENVVVRAAINAGAGAITAEHLHELRTVPAAAPGGAEPPETTLKPDLARSFAVEAAAPEAVERVEREAIIAALLWNHGAVVRTARQLGIGRTTLYRKLKEYALDPEEFREETERMPPVGAPFAH
jgi:DNA-binding NtrC family response regulator